MKQRRPFLTMPTVLLYFSAVGILGSCRQAAPQVYQSGGNDAADIRLELRPNGAVDLRFRPLEDSAALFKGQWHTQGNQTTITFPADQNPSFTLAYLFDQKLDKEHTVRLVDQQTVAFGQAARYIYIWGIRCDKEP